MNHTDTSLDRLFIGINRGSLQSFELLHKILYGKLVQFCIGFVKHKEPAEEIVSDVFINLWMKRAQLKGIRNPGVYLFVSVKNSSLNYLKKNAGAKIIAIGNVERIRMDASVLPDEEIDTKELFKAMHLAIDELPEQCKIIFNLVKENGMKTREVAALLHLSTRTVETQIFRAVKKLNKTLSPYISSTSFRKKNKPASFLLFLIIFLLLL